MKLRIKSVGELNNYIAKVLERDAILSNTLVRGVVSGLRGRDGDHLYFDLIDPQDNSLIKCVLFKGQRALAGMELANDIAVVISGKLSVYRIKGYNQIIVRSVEYDEEARYHNEYLRLEKKYRALGYFDERRKLLSLPRIRKIGLIASKISAAYGDFMKIISSNFPLLDIRFIDVHVSGEYTKIDIPLAIKKLNERRDLDLIVITRGGGSEEELFIYNDEAICSAVYSSRIPILCAVGHQRDRSHMDSIAHMSVGTPSMAASLIVERHRRDIKDINTLILNLHAMMSSRIEGEKKSLASELKNLGELLIQRMAMARRDVASRTREALSYMDQSLALTKKDIAHNFEVLKSYDIEETLARGYALVTKAGKMVRPEDLSLGDRLDIRLSGADLGVSLDSIELRGVEDGKETRDGKGI